jgi:hypothetical protein
VLPKEGQGLSLQSLGGAQGDRIEYEGVGTMIDNDTLFWSFVVYDLVKSVIILWIGIKWGFSYGVKRADLLLEAALKPKAVK